MSASNSRTGDVGSWSFLISVVNRVFLGGELSSGSWMVAKRWFVISVSVRMDTDGEKMSTRQCVHDDVVL